MANEQRPSTVTLSVDQLESLKALVLSSVKEKKSVTPKPGVEYDPYEEPVLYLRSKGYKPLGDPRWEFTRWLSPHRPLKETQKWVVKEAMHFDGYEADGKTPKHVMKPVQVKNQNGQHAPVKQLEVTPEGRPMTINECLLEAITMDTAAQEAKVKETAKAG